MNFRINTAAQLLTSMCCIIALAIGFAACSEDEVNPGLITLKENSTLGSVLVDGKGRTLYVFSKDVNNQSQCTGTCLTEWRIYYASNLKPAEGIDAAEFNTITRSDGAKQTTFKGWPLYVFTGDKKSGDANGNGVENVWFAAKPDYSIMVASAQLVGKDGKNYTSTYTEGTGETEYFTDARGRTLYSFKNDFTNINKYTSSDFSNDPTWPIFHTPITSLPSTLNIADFGEINVHGRFQLTYKGRPLYYYGEDTASGQNKGVSVGSTPGTWPVVNTQTTGAPDQPTVMLTTNTTHGPIITDNQGRTLYFFASDSKGANTCIGGCVTLWPIFNVSEIKLPVGSTLVVSDFAFIGDGATRQVTYKGRPLYYYAPGTPNTLEATGQTLGDNVGTVWFVAKPDYSLMVARAQLVGNDGKNYTSAYVEGTGTTRYFTDATGRTIYAFGNDKNNTNTFTNATFSNDASWPIFHVNITKLPTGMNASDFGTITIHGTRSQLTYKGWPLYYFGGDAAKGDTKGVSVGAVGRWPVINTTTVVAPN